ncbi:TIGR00730 family Rossman fold protein [Haloechinothrix salitolerans]|uniref:Cytokinin riboside 5'-monophosphate phosphoribohydrolase n=1 Tax=Haloechinothrix salitolerans TaxID=926830 RepID=A0ABW2C6X8_9PSEU
MARLGPIKAVCVFCGSSTGTGSRYVDAATSLGEHLARSGVRVVYGGAHVGTMGVLADAALAAGGEVVGVIPEGMVEREIAHTGLTELHVVADMHERKALMSERADAFIALPGGAGTLEELFEVWTWAQLGLHAKPIGLLDIDGFYQPLRAMTDHMVDEGFLRAGHRDALLFDTDPDRLLRGLAEHRLPEVNKWAG